MPINIIGAVQVSKYSRDWSFFCKYVDSQGEEMRLDFMDITKLEVNEEKDFNDVKTYDIFMGKNDDINLIINWVDLPKNMPQVYIDKDGIRASYHISIPIFQQLFEFCKKHNNSNFFPDRMFILGDEDPAPGVEHTNNNPQSGGRRKRKNLKTRRR